MPLLARAESGGRVEQSSQLGLEALRSTAAGEAGATPREPAGREAEEPTAEVVKRLLDERAGGLGADPVGIDRRLVRMAQVEDGRHGVAHQPVSLEARAEVEVEVLRRHRAVAVESPHHARAARQSRVHQRILEQERERDALAREERSSCGLRSGIGACAR